MTEIKSPKMTNEEIANLVIEAVPTKIKAELATIKGCSHLDKPYRELLKERDELQTQLSLAKDVVEKAESVLLQIACPKCEFGDGIDHHEGAGCVKREALLEIEKWKSTTPNSKEEA